MAEGNSGRGHSQPEGIDFLQAQKKFSEILKSHIDRLDQYFWRLTGKEPNSLCMVLGIGEDILKAILKTCKVYIGEFDNVSKMNFELLMDHSGLDWTVFKMKGNGVNRFIKLGKRGNLVLPKNMYGSDGELVHYPVQGQHITSTTRTKSQQEPLAQLIELCSPNDTRLLFVRYSDQVRREVLCRE
jgi:hypothetical protein